MWESSPPTTPKARSIKPAEKTGIKRTRKGVALVNLQHQTPQIIADPLVMVIVGQKPYTQTFYIHKTLLTRSSPYMTAALKSEWQRQGEIVLNNLEHSQQYCLSLPTDDPAAVSIFAAWLYTGTVYIKPQTEESSQEHPLTKAQLDRPNYAKAVLSARLIMETYFFADRIGAADFCDALIDAFQLHVVSTKFTFIDLTGWVWDNTEKKDPLRKY